MTRHSIAHRHAVQASCWPSAGPRWPTAWLSPLVGYLLAGVLAGPFTPGFVGDPGAGAAAGRDRGDPADVRGRPAFLAARPDGGEEHPPSRRGGADRGDLLGLAGRVMGWRARGHVRLLAGHRQHRGAAAGDGGTPPAGHPPRQDRGGLADRGGPGLRDGAGADPGAGRRIGRGRESAAPPTSSRRWRSPSARSQPSSRSC